MELDQFEPDNEPIEKIIHWLAVERLDKDLKRAAEQMTRDDVRLMLKLYYDQQRQRVRMNNQLDAAKKDNRPYDLFEWAVRNYATFEKNCQNSLDTWSRQYPIVADWAKPHLFGVGPLICAGLVSNLAEDTPKTVGHWWSYAGLQPMQTWQGEEKSKQIIGDIIGKMAGPIDLDDLFQVALNTKRKGETLRRFATTTATGTQRPLTVQNLAKALARRPWNAFLKTILWRFAQVQIKLYHRYPDKSQYGPLYYERKAYEQDLNERGELAHEAERALREKRYGRETAAYKHYAAGRLPPAHIQARAYRWIEKMFLAHWHQVSWELQHHTPVVRPWVVEYKGHTNIIPPPGWPPPGFKYKKPPDKKDD